MYKTIVKYEHENLYVGDQGFKEKHWKAFVKLNSLHGNKYFNILNHGIGFKEYVGILQIDGLSIEIHPKADKDDENAQWRNVLLSMLQTCGRLSPKSVGTADVNRRNLNLLEIYFELFINEINILIRQGLIKKYRKQTKNVTALKGKLEFAGNIRYNLVHKERFYTTHQVYDKDHIIHQVLAVALEIVSGFNRSSYISGKIAITRFSFPEVKNIKVNKATFDKISISRKSKPYAYALSLARLIILNYSPGISSGNEKMLSLLFNMNDLWEEYVLIQLRKHLTETYSNWSVKGQESKGFIANHSLRPDIVLKNKKTNKTIIIDTKWKLGNRHISVQDLRQVYTYGRYWNAKKVMLLYPGKESNNAFKEYINEFDATPKHQCKLGFVSVLNKEGLLNQNMGQKIIDLLEIKTIF